MWNVPTHSSSFRLRRFLNWFPLGLAYAFLYMGRYNLTVAKTALGDLLPKEDFGNIMGVGTFVYGVSFLLNGPLNDRIGGRRTMLLGVFGAILANAAMGFVLYGIAAWHWNLPVVSTFMALYAVNMYFQSFGAVSIVTVKAPWFHVRERGTFSTIFGVMIALGIYFAFDWGYAIVDATRAVPEKLGLVASAFHRLLGDPTGVHRNWWLFFIPSMILGVLWIVLLLFLRDRPSQAGFQDFDTGEDSVSKDGERLPIRAIFVRILSHPILLVICGIEFCSGVLRNGVMNWSTIFAKEVGIQKTQWVFNNWGLTQLLAGLVGAFLTGWASDRFFQSRRGPMAAILYCVMLACAIGMCFVLTSGAWVVASCVAVIAMCFIGVHGILSGTATVDFGGTKNGGAAVGIVDGFVYLGISLQSFVAGHTTPVKEAAKDPANWTWWPAFLVPFALIGLLLSIRIWNAAPKKKGSAMPSPVTARITAPETS